jgi:RNA polymerase sigma factor (sigma-70 family)
MMTDLDRQALLARARTGDKESLNLLLTLSRGAAYRTAHRLLCRKRDGKCMHGRCRNHHDIEDVLQEAFSDVTTKFNDFRSQEYGAFVKWVCVITSTKAKSFLTWKTKPERHTGRQTLSLNHMSVGPNGEERRIDVIDPKAHETLDRIAALETLETRLARLDYEERYVLVRKHLDGCTFARIAEEMRRELWQVYALYRKALRKAAES